MTKIIKGRAASQGIAKGVARLILTESDFSKFKSGEILITKQTSPAWTPLFASAGAIVTDLGGILCHAAIVAREYGIPAVVGTHNATEQIKNGDIIEVDGNNGEIKILY